MANGIPGSSRGSVGSYGSQSQGGSTMICCNRCQKTLTTTLFVCTCDCVFCEGCTYDHFGASSTCPTCHRQLGAKDFMELSISDPSTASNESLKTTFQTMFTKYSSNSHAVSHTEMCARALKALDDDRRAVRFLLKQFVKESSMEGRRSGDLGQENSHLRKEVARLKQASSSERTNYEQTLNEMKSRIQGLNSTVQKQQHKIQQQDLMIRERSNQVTQYREMFSSGSRVPPSSHSTGSGSGGGGSRGRMGSTPPMQHRFTEHHRNSLASGSPHQPHHHRGSNNNGEVPMSSVGVSPVQIPHSSLGNGSAPPFSRNGGGQPPFSRSGAPPMSRSGVAPPTPRIRDFSSSSGYRFQSSSSHGGKRRLLSRQGSGVPVFGGRR